MAILPDYEVLNQETPQFHTCPPGYEILEGYYSDGFVHIMRCPVVGWNVYGATALPVGMYSTPGSGLHSYKAIKLPDGRVISYRNRDDEWVNEETWREHMQHFADHQQINEIHKMSIEELQAFIAERGYKCNLKQHRNLAAMRKAVVIAAGL